MSTFQFEFIVLGTKFRTKITASTQYEAIYKLHEFIKNKTIIDIVNEIPHNRENEIDKLFGSFPDDFKDIFKIK